MTNKNVNEYYKSEGWATDENGYFIDTLVNENLQNAAVNYNSQTRRRVLSELLDQPGNRFEKLLDCASGPVQYPEYVEYSARYKVRYCLDFSPEALKYAELNLRAAGQNNCEFICNDFLVQPFEENFFDSAVSLHTLYHVNKQQQEEFVRKLISCVKPNGKIIVVYSNPYSLRSCIAAPYNLLVGLASFVKNKLFLNKKSGNQFYFARHNIGWWKRFEKKGNVVIKSYRFLNPKVEKSLIPDSQLGFLFYKFLFYLETKAISKYLCEYYIVIITKKY